MYLTEQEESLVLSSGVNSATRDDVISSSNDMFQALMEDL